MSTWKDTGSGDSAGKPGAAGSSTAMSTLSTPADASQWSETLRDGSRVTIRAMQKGDAGLERAFLHGLSPESCRMRFLGQIGEPDDALVGKLTDVDYQHDMAFIAVVQQDGHAREIGVSRYSLAQDGISCECAVTVADAWQNKGLGTLLMRHLIDMARQRGIRTMVSIDSAENWRMRDLARDLGFTRQRDPSDATQVVHRLTL
jgi:GNAT superfamily N-acetyltransferase